MKAISLAVTVTEEATLKEPKLASQGCRSRSLRPGQSVSRKLLVWVSKKEADFLAASHQDANLENCLKWKKHKLTVQTESSAI